MTGGWEKSGEVTHMTQRALKGQWVVPINYIMNSIKKPTHKVLRKPCLWILPIGPWATPAPCVPHPYSLSTLANTLCMVLKMVGKSKLQRMASEHAQKVGPNLQASKVTNLRCGTTFGKKEMVRTGHVCCRTERRRTSLRILPQEGARCMEQMY